MHFKQATPVASTTATRMARAPSSVVTRGVSAAPSAVARQSYASSKEDTPEDKKSVLRSQSASDIVQNQINRQKSEEERKKFIADFKKFEKPKTNPENEQETIYQLIVKEGQKNEGAKNTPLGPTFGEKELDEISGIPPKTKGVPSGPKKPISATACADASPISTAASSTSAPTGNIPQLPEFKGRTEGILVPTNPPGEPILLQSSERTGARFPYSQADGHVETLAALYMKKNGIKAATVYHNHPKGTCPNCNRSLPAFLEESSQLKVVPAKVTDFSEKTWKATEKTYIGNSDSPYLEA